MADRKRSVGVGVTTLGLGHEALPRHLRHRREHALVVDPPATELALDHPLPLLGELPSSHQKMYARSRRGSSTVTRPRPTSTTPARSSTARNLLTLSREVPASCARSAWVIRIVIP